MAVFVFSPQNENVDEAAGHFKVKPLKGKGLGFHFSAIIKREGRCNRGRGVYGEI